MMVETSLLVTDDPDDHQAFTEALSEVSVNTIVLIVLDSEKALRLLEDKKHMPDYIFLDLSMHGIRINSFLKVINSNTELSAVPTVVYGEEDDFAKIANSENLTFFNKEYEYSELRNFLKNFIKPAN